MHHDESTSLLPGVSTIVATEAHLALCGLPWTLDALQVRWGGSPEMADRWISSLVEAHVIVLTSGGRYTIPESVRMELLTALLNSGALEEVRSVLLEWREEAAEHGDTRMMAEAHLWLANILALSGRWEDVLAELQTMFALYQAAQDLEGVTRASWMIGTLLAERGSLAGAAVPVACGGAGRGAWP